MKPLLLCSLLLFAGGVRAADATYADFLATGRTQFEAKDFDGARASMQSALAVAKTPDEKVGALSRIAKTFDGQNNFARAREFYTQALAQPGIGPKDKREASFGVAEEFHKEKQLVEARKAYETILADPQTPPEFRDVARFNIAQVLLEQGQTAQGRQMLSNMGDSTALIYLRMGALVQLGQSFRDQKNWEAARAEFDKALALPELSSLLKSIVHKERIKTFTGQNDVASAQKEAELFANEMLKFPPDATPTQKVERTLAALGVLESPDAHTPPILLLSTHEWFATALLASGDLKQGREQMEYVLKVLQPLEADPTQRNTALKTKARALWNLAGSYEGEGNLQKSRELLEQLLLVPDLAPDLKEKAQKKLADAKK